MRIVVAAVGRAKEPAFRALLDEYYARIRRHATLDERELRQAGEDRLAADVASLVRSAGPHAVLVVLDVGGRTMSSDAFARQIQRWRESACSPLFLIGGADGIPDAVVKGAHLRLSLGAMTLPHRLARVVLAEQIYRAFTILSGEPYPR